CDADCSLREAVIAANATAAADTIVLPAGTYAFTRAGKNEDAASTGDLDVTNPLTIRGGGAATTTIDAAGLDRVFQVVPLTAHLTLEDLTVTGGTDAGDLSGLSGGGILVTNGQLTLLRAVVRGNTAQFGGGIQVANGIVTGAAGSVTVLDSEIRDNTAIQQGGGIYANALVLANTIRVFISRSLVDGNSASGRAGGIFASAGRGLVIRKSTISNNSDLSQGGGLAFFTNTEVVLRDTLFADNTATSIGGGVVANGPLRIEACRFERNATSGSGTGGGISIFSSHPVMIRDSLFVENTAGNGGGLSAQGGGALEVIGSTFVGNSALDWGGAIYNAGSTPLTIRNSTLTANAVTNGASTGGAIRANTHPTGFTRLVHATVADNTSGGAGSQLSCFECADRILVANSIVSGSGATANCAADVLSEGGNVESGASCAFDDPTDLSNADPLLAALAANGGVTETRAIGAGSPAVGAAVEANCEPSDQRGFARDASCDSGAVERGAQVCTGDFETAEAWVGYFVDEILDLPLGTVVPCMRNFAGL
ncbi:MAG: hypothetical protein KC466_14230, partial [Myxococcales bacterium]|nr:hypothetical protein [Myxococcales bacterium]